MKLFLDSLSYKERQEYNKLKELVRQGGSISSKELQNIIMMLNSHRQVFINNGEEKRDPLFNNYYNILIDRGVKINAE